MGSGQRGEQATPCRSLAACPPTCLLHACASQLVEPSGRVGVLPMPGAAGPTGGILVPRTACYARPRAGSALWEAALLAGPRVSRGPNRRDLPRYMQGVSHHLLRALQLAIAHHNANPGNKTPAPHSRAGVLSCDPTPGGLPPTEPKSEDFQLWVPGLSSGSSGGVSSPPPSASSSLAMPAPVPASNLDSGQPRRGMDPGGSFARRGVR